MKEAKDNFDYWKELYRSLGITIYLRKPLSPAVFAANSISDLTDAGVYEVTGLRARLVAAKKDLSVIILELFDRECKSIIGQVVKGLTLDEQTFKSAHDLEGRCGLRVLGIYGANVSVEIPGCVISSAALNWKKIQGDDNYFKMIHVFPEQSRENVTTAKTVGLAALA